MSKFVIELVVDGEVVQRHELKCATEDKATRDFMTHWTSKIAKGNGDHISRRLVKVTTDVVLVETDFSDVNDTKDFAIQLLIQGIKADDCDVWSDTKWLENSGKCSPGDLLDTARSLNPTETYRLVKRVNR